MQKIREMPLSAKSVKDRTIKMAEDITKQQIKDINSAAASWNAIPDTYINMKKYAFGVLSIFGSTYACEQLFSTMNYVNKQTPLTPHRRQLTVLRKDESDFLQP